MQIQESEDAKFSPMTGMISALLIGRASVLGGGPSRTYTGPCLIPATEHDLELSVGSKVFVVDEPLDAESANLLESTIGLPHTASRILLQHASMSNMSRERDGSRPETKELTRRRSSVIVPNGAGGVRSITREDSPPGGQRRKSLPNRLPRPPLPGMRQGGGHGGATGWQYHVPKGMHSHVP